MSETQKKGTFACIATRRSSEKNDSAKAIANLGRGGERWIKGGGGIRRRGGLR